MELWGKKLVPSAGVEPTPLASEASTLSIELRGRTANEQVMYTAICGFASGVRGVEVFRVNKLQSCSFFTQAFFLKYV